MGLVLDASVVIVLDELDLLRTLLEAGPPLVIPREVLSEVESGRVHALVQSSKLQVVAANPDLVQLEFRPQLGRGELSVLAYCLEHRSDWAVVDDLTGREIAQRLSLKCIGTARLLKYMELRGLLGGQSLQNTLARLRDLGFWVSAAVITRVLEERPPDLSR